MDTQSTPKTTEYYRQRLEELEKQYGREWVKKKFSAPPQIGDKYYAFTLRMNKAYRDREFGVSPTNSSSDHQMSPGLKGSIVGYNGTRKSKKALTPTQFYALWEMRMMRKKGSIHRTYVSEAQANPIVVMKLIEGLFIKKNNLLEVQTVPEKKFHPESIKKSKSKKVLIPHGSEAEIQQTVHDVYYTDGGTLFNGTSQQRSRICVFKNGNLHREDPVGNKTNNEAEYLALIEALKDIPKENKAIIYSDSKLIVLTFLGEWKTKEPRLAILRDEARKFMTENIAIEWIPREDNLAGFYLEDTYGF